MNNLYIFQLLHTVFQNIWVARKSHKFFGPHYGRATLLGRTTVWSSHYGLIRGLWVARWSDQRSFESHYGRTISWVALRSDQRALGRRMVWSEGKVWKIVWSVRFRVAHLNLGRALIGFGEVKATKTDNFLCLNPKNFSTRVWLPTPKSVWSDRPSIYIRSDWIPIELLLIKLPRPKHSNQNQPQITVQIQPRALHRMKWITCWSPALTHAPLKFCAKTSEMIALIGICRENCRSLYVFLTGVSVFDHYFSSTYELIVFELLRSI